MKSKKLTQNARNFVSMGIELNKPKTRIYLHGISKGGDDQWYESIRVFTKSTATQYYYGGQYSVVFAGGIRNSKKQNWD
jgi:hypothetical protein